MADGRSTERNMAVERAISSGSHVLEPVNLWVEQMEQASRTQAPHVVHNLPGYQDDDSLGNEHEPARQEVAQGHIVAGHLAPRPFDHMSGRAASPCPRGGEHSDWVK